MSCATPTSCAICIERIGAPTEVGAPTRDPSYPQQGNPQHAPSAQQAAAKAVGEAAKAVLLIVAAPRAIRPIIFFILYSPEICVSFQPSAGRGGGRGGRIHRPSPWKTAAENRRSESRGRVAATSGGCGITAGAQATRQAGPAIGQLACFSPQQPLAVPVAGHAAAAMADPLAAIATSSATRRERNRGMKGLRPRVGSGYNRSNFPLSYLISPR